MGMCSCFILGFLFGLLVGVSFRGARLTDQVLGDCRKLGDLWIRASKV